MPKSKLDFWRTKLEGNRLRDARKRRELEDLGWSVVEVWECQTGEAELDSLGRRLREVPVAPPGRKGESV
jgi:DNA mismatch endonuclease (patch repair protein)